MADKPTTALYELLGPELQDMQGIGYEQAERLMVTPIAMPDDTRVANLDDEEAIQFGVFNELSASAYETYQVPKHWATAFDEAGFAGIRYISRMVAGWTSASWAVFGASGPAPDMPFLADGARPAIDLLREMGVSILGEQTSDELNVIQPPEWA